MISDTVTVILVSIVIAAYIAYVSYYAITHNGDASDINRPYPGVATPAIPSPAPPSRVVYNSPKYIQAFKLEMKNYTTTEIDNIDNTISINYGNIIFTAGQFKSTGHPALFYFHKTKNSEYDYNLNAIVDMGKYAPASYTEILYITAHSDTYTGDSGYFSIAVATKDDNYPADNLKSRSQGLVYLFQWKDYTSVELVKEIRPPSLDGFKLQKFGRCMQFIETSARTVQLFVSMGGNTRTQTSGSIQVYDTHGDWQYQIIGGNKDYNWSVYFVAQGTTLVVCEPDVPLNTDPYSDPHAGGMVLIYKYDSYRNIWSETQRIKQFASSLVLSEGLKYLFIMAGGNYAHEFMGAYVLDSSGKYINYARNSAVTGMIGQITCAKGGEMVLCNTTGNAAYICNFDTITNKFLTNQSQKVGDFIGNHVAFYHNKLRNSATVIVADYRGSNIYFYKMVNVVH